MRRLWLLLLLTLALSACTLARPSLARDLLGTWENPDGFRVEFRPDGVGFIPGVAGAIPDTQFSYEIVDEATVRMNVQDQAFTVSVAIVGDQLTWTDTLGEVIYTRVKE